MQISLATTLCPVGNGIWQLVQPFRLMGAELGRRLTVVRLPDGALWLHAPPAPTPAVRKALEALGPVAFIVAPNRLHDAFLDEFTKAYASAKLYAAPGFDGDHRHLPSIHPLGPVPPKAWADLIDQRLVEGMPKLNEFVFLHRPSASLIVADLVFNIRAPKPWLTRVLMSLNGNAYNRVVKWTPSFGQENAESKLASQALLH